MRKIFTSLLFVCMLLVGISSFAQVKTITGKVTSSDDNGPLPGASIKVKGANTGASTDGNGNFTIQVSSSNAVLVVSLIGYKTQEVTVGNRTTVNLALASDSQQLEEVTVSTGLGITRQAKSLGYAAQQVDNKALNFNHQPNLINALQGKVAGATISSMGGGPGQGANIRIRGVNSIDPSIPSDPLYVIDGVQIDNSTSTLGANPGGTAYGARGVSNRASDINPEDIETINILKGGAATALYGLRGVNGVVVITTKRGAAGALSINLNSSYGFDEVLKKPAVQTEYTQGVLGVYANPPSGIGPAWGPTIAEAKLLDPTHPDQLYDNYDRAFGTGQQIKNSVSVAGGSEAVKFFSSVSQLYQKGMMPNTDYKNLSGRLNTDITISPKFKASVNMNFSNAGGYTYSADRFGEGLAYWSPRYDVADYINENGTQKYIGTNNPIWGTETNQLKSDVNRFIGGAALTYEPTKWLNFSYRFGLDTYNDNRVRTAPGPMGITGEQVYDNDQGFYGEYNSKVRTLNGTFLATLTSKITSDINGTLRLGQEMYDSRLKNIGSLGSQLSIYNFFNLANAKVISVSQSITQKRLVGYFGEATFDYKNYLFLTLTGRNDITSTLSKENRSFFYPSASISYVFSDQFKLPSAISQAKLRLSYAKLGKDAPIYAGASSGFATYGSLPTGTTGLTLASNLGNPSLRPEFTNTFETGLEMSFFKGRLGFDFTYYYSLSKDQIIQAQITSATGYVTTSINAGNIRNRGVELVINGKPIDGKDFKWGVNLNVSANRNKILYLPTDIIYGAARGYGNAGVTMKLVEGQAFGNIYGSYFNRYSGGQPQDPNFLDKNLPLLIGADGFPIISGGTQRILGNSQPDYVIGMGNNFSYKRFSLNVLFDARLGFEKYNWLEDFYSAFGLPDYTADRRSFRTFEGVLANGTPNTKQVWLGQRFGPDGVDYGEGYYRRFYRNVSEPFVTDASWVRLRSASLSYALPTNWLPKKAIRSASVSVTGNNLWLWTKYYGVDPESSSYDAGSNNDGSAGFTYPTARTIMFSLNVGF
ncbi:SusC/RagA family TonB-linked outer membrane protein [Pedobacter agri]|uniref:SusC/RagA family TonB-linked outer membrane protein n=1 Tax=Pedobacter agri TaxID=454586 RepID=A0A9X3DAA7_9SPHI|nr:SusC/RagA family TonB-linked outer membrane protein [Pedobacter agri]MCX3263792.1 SusC/RagA family TonB-linked outer membrane protein [Pedobacter agri]